MFCAPRLFFDGTEGVGSRFHILRSRTRFRRYQGCRVPFSCFAPPDSFLSVLKASGPVFIFCALELVFGGTEGIRSRFHLLRSWTRFRWYRGRRVPSSCFACPAVSRASVPVFMFCAARLIFGSKEGVGSRFHVLRSRARFRRYRGCRVSISFFALPDSFLAVLRASGPVFMFCARSHFRRYRGRRVPFSYFALPDLFSAVPRALGPVFIFCASRLVFDGTKGVRSGFNILRSRTRFRRYRGPRVPFSCFALPGTFSAVRRASSLDFIFCAPGIISGVPMASVPVFMFCAPRLVFGSTEGVG
jgi:hypothetical protein